MFGIEERFMQLQGDGKFFYFECLVTVYLLMATGIISEKFLMPSLENISAKYKLSATIAGVLIAFGIAVPELAVTLLSFQRHGIKMTEFGLATVFGSVCFCVTFVPAFAYFANYGIRHARPEPSKDELEQNSRLMKAFVRDIGFIILGLAAYWHFLAKESLTLTQCILLILLFLIYVGVICFQVSQESKAQAQSKAEKSEIALGESEQQIVGISLGQEANTVVNRRAKKSKSTNKNDANDYDLIDNELDITDESEDNGSSPAGQETSKLIGNNTIDNKNNEDKEEKSGVAEHKHEPALELIEKFCCIVIWPLSLVMPVQRFPELALAMVFVLIYFLCEFILTVFNVFSVYFGLSHFVVGLTLMVWGSDNLELINMIIAIKNSQLEIGLTSVMSCQLICLIVIIPIAAMARMQARDQYEIQVMQTQHSRDMVVMPVLICTTLSLLIFLAKEMSLDRKSAVSLVVIYTVYIWYNISVFGGDAD